MQCGSQDVQSNVDMIAEALLGHSEWTVKEVEHVLACARALVRSHERIDLGHRIITTVDGRALWDLMGALDRVNRDRRL
jgi:hypothetical protein